MPQLKPNDHCRHADSVIARRVFSDGTEHFGVHCLRCGKWESIKRVSFHESQKAVEYDPEIARRYSQSQVERFRQEQADKNAQWWQKYDEYINSEEWKRRSRKVLERDNYLCQACLERRANQSHHLTYKHFGWEPLFDLIAVCDLCHTYLHKKERELNGTRS